MKKYYLVLAFMFVNFVTFSQKMTFQVTFDEIKSGHGPAYADAMEKFRAKYVPASEYGGIVAFNVLGGKHDGKIVFMNAKPRSFAERDTPWMPKEGQRESYWLNVEPHIESRHKEIFVFRPEYSNSKYEDGKDVEKYLMTEWTIINGSKAGDEFRKRMIKVHDKLGRKMAVFSTATGVNKVYYSRRLPNGWKELDEDVNVEAVYDELYGKGAWAKEMVIMSTYWEKTDIFMMTKNKALSSK